MGMMMMGVRTVMRKRRKEKEYGAPWKGRRKLFYFVSIFSHGSLLTMIGIKSVFSYSFGTKSTTL
jgi:hypothetical protein